MPDRRFLLRHALGEMLIYDTLRTPRGIQITRVENRRYELCAGPLRKPFRMHRHITDAQLWELTDLVLQLEIAGSVVDHPSNR
jgi:hypothetical protein